MSERGLPSKKVEANAKRKVKKRLHDKGITESITNNKGPSDFRQDWEKVDVDYGAQLKEIRAEKKVKDVSADPEKVSNVMALLKRNKESKESNEPSPEAADQVELPEKKEDSGFWSGVGKSFSGENLGEALAYFSPDIIGGILGYALGGGKGALEGLQHANKLRLGVDEQRRKDREFNLKQAQILGLGKKSKMQQTEGKYFVDSEGQKHYVYFDPNLGHVYRGSNDKISKVPQGVRIEDPKDVRQIRGIGEKREMKAASATEGTLKLLKGLQDLERHFPNIDKFSGKVKGRITSMKIWAGQAGEQGVSLSTEVDDLTKMYVFALSGVAVREIELEQAKKIVPQLNDEPATFKYKTKALKRIMDERISLVKQHYTKEEIGRRLKKSWDSEIKLMKKKGMRLSTGVKSMKDYEKEAKERKRKNMKTYGIQ